MAGNPKAVSVIFQDVSFRYDGMERLVVERLTAHFPAGWTGIAGANGAGEKHAYPSHSRYRERRTGVPVRPAAGQP